MPLIEWSEEYSVKVPSVDTQHKKLVDMVNKLHDAMMAGKGADVVGKVIHELVEYTKTHFSDEEKLMQEKNYPGLEEHRKIHKELTDKVVKLERDYKGGSFSLSVEVKNFLKDWLVDHIKKEDKKYTPYLSK